MMKVFVLINEQDTDASNQSTVQLFLNCEYWIISCDGITRRLF